MMAFQKISGDSKQLHYHKDISDEDIRLDQYSISPQHIQYKMRITYGIKDKPLHSSIQRASNLMLRTILQRRGLNPKEYDIDDRNVLLQKVSNEMPFIDFVIDGREDLRSCLVVALDTYNWDKEQSYEVILPYRGENFVGVSTFYHALVNCNNYNDR